MSNGAERQELTNEIHRLHEQNAELLVRLEQHGRRSRWQDVDLTDEQKTVLVAISKGDLNRLFASKKISAQRIGLAKDQLLELGLIGYGPESAYAKSAGRKWLDQMVCSTRGALREVVQ